ncbi:MAG: thioredoxin family protein [Verrucomicrobiae bacterium]
MKRLLLSAIVLATSTVFAGDGWLTDYKAALEQAAKENKPVLLDFTGSDWCGWCVKLDKETFSEDSFKKFAAGNLILVEIDFPRNKPQSDEVKKQNRELQAQFGVDGFPTLVLLDSKGKEIAKNPGYLAGGPDALIAWVKKAAK